VEDSTFTGIAMRNVNTAPLFLRLGARLRGPKPETVVGSIKRVLISNVTSSNADMMPSIIAGIQGHPIEDVKISDVYLQQVGGGSAEMARIEAPDKADAYPEPTMFGDLPATGFFVRHAKCGSATWRSRRKCRRAARVPPEDTDLWTCSAVC
jgi:polygalacturonase